MTNKTIGRGSSLLPPQLYTVRPAWFPFISSPTPCPTSQAARPAPTLRVLQSPALLKRIRPPDRAPCPLPLASPQPRFLRLRCADPVCSVLKACHTGTEPERMVVGGAFPQTTRLSIAPSPKEIAEKNRLADLRGRLAPHLCVTSSPRPLLPSLSFGNHNRPPPAEGEG